MKNTFPPSLPPLKKCLRYVQKFLVQNGGRGLPFFWPDGTTGFLRKYKEKHSRFFLFSSLVAVLRLLGGASPLSFGTSRLFYKKIFFIFIF
jgi:hypothetical protein